MNILNKTESAVFKYCRFFLFLKDLFFQIILNFELSELNKRKLVIEYYSCHQIRISDILSWVRFLSYPYYLTEAIMCGLFIGCINLELMPHSL